MPPTQATRRLTQHRATRLLVGAIVLGCVGGVVAVATTASEAVAQRPDDGALGIRLLDAPAESAPDPRAQVYIIDHLAPGSTIHRRVEVSNTTAEAIDVELYPAAASISKGSFLGAAGHTPNELSTWTTISPPTVAVEPGGTALATVSISVPDDAAPGEQYGAVWAQTQAPGDSPGGVVEVNRVGIRLYLSVGPGGPPAADFTIDSLTAERSADGSPRVLATVHNTGGRALDMYGTMSLTNGPGELSAGPFPAALGTTLAIGDTETVSIPLDGSLPAGPWDARVTLHSGLLNVSAEATITFPDQGAATPVAADGSRRLWQLLLAIGLALGALIGLFALFWSRRRRQKVRLAHSAG
jgi:hypothetical protein